MKNWIPPKKLLMFIMATMTVCVILYFISLFVVLIEIKKIEDYYSNTESKSGKEERTRILRSIAETNKENIQALRGFFVQKGDEVRFIEQIEATGRKSGIQFEISAIDVKGNQIKNFKEDITVKMNIQGSWENVINFIDILEKMNFGVSIQNLNLDTKISNDWSGTVEFIIFREK